MSTSDRSKDNHEQASPVPDAGLPRVAPDVIEQEAGDLIDNIVPSYGYQMTPMVGLGGSAGSIGALKSFFEATPPKTGVVYVVVLHLSPHHASAMAEMIGKWTPMPVTQAVDGEKVSTDHVYVIPPGKHLIAVDGHLRLTDLQYEQGRRVAVDLFFRSLADSHGPHVAAVVLSGADGDGVLGVRRIKERGGLTIAQDPEEAEYPGMPRTSIESGMIDWVLKAGEMPRRIMAYVAREPRLQLPSEDGPQPASPRDTASQSESAFRDILAFLRTRTGRDFSYYKRATILRRIARRMQVNAVDDMPGYLAFMRTHPGEAGALLKDLLISVTNFFRDRDAFAALAARIPALFHGKGPTDTVRVWCPACATGEEAYSIAMLLIEHARTLDQPPAIQVFGCDLDDEAVAAARNGAYPEAIAADVSEERLRRFFVKDYRGYRVRRDLREIVLFASHDLLKDAPFSRLDLVSCRNLLIYLTREAQDRALDIFHFALKHDGLLFLGSSESVDEESTLFRVVDKKHRIYVRKPTARVGLPMPAGPSIALASRIAHQVGQQRADAATRDVVVPPGAFTQSASVTVGGRLHAARDDERVSWSELHFKLIERFGPPSILVDRDYDIQHLSQNAGRFLQVNGGEPTTNLLRLVNPALRLELRALLFRAGNTGEPAEAFRIPADIDGKPRLVDMRVLPVVEATPDLLVVTFDLAADEATPVAPSPDGARPPPEPVVRHLERELEQMKGHLRDTVEQYEASTEELKASNEELQAMNEKLRSATEELETSREELQSINEELTTVNQELKSKVEELAHANSDLHNLMSATAIATLFLDRDMRVMRYTDSAAPIFNLIPGDIGRPLAHLQHRIDYPEMARDAASVLDKLTPVSREVEGAGGVSYHARMLPYRTQDDRIAGVVLTFFDITEQERAKRALNEDLAATERLRRVATPQIGPDAMGDLHTTIVDAAIEIAHADGATIQILDSERGVLELLASKGMHPALVERFRSVAAGAGTICEQALHGRTRVFVDFAQSRPGTADADRAHLEAGVRCAQSTPLVTRGGVPIGMITTHWSSLYEPSERELRYMDLLARLAADAIERQFDADAMRVHVDELTRFNEASVGRETRMIELKKEVNALSARLGEAPRYSLDFERDAD
jgi:two-component system CheB/CheR fusion protein